MFYIYLSNINIYFCVPQYNYLTGITGFAMIYYDILGREFWGIKEVEGKVCKKRGGNSWSVVVMLYQISGISRWHFMSTLGMGSGQSWLILILQHAILIQIIWYNMVDIISYDITGCFINIDICRFLSLRGIASPSMSGEGGQLKPHFFSGF